MADERACTGMKNAGEPQVFEPDDAVLLAARWVHPRLNWMLPCLLAVVVPVIVLRVVDDPATVVNERFQPDWWVLPGQNQDSVMSWVMAIGLLVVGILVIGYWGPKVEVGEG
jgi:hypothetical protein